MRKEKWSENRANYLWNRKMGALSSRRKCLKNKHDENELAKLKLQSECSEQNKQAQKNKTSKRRRKTKKVVANEQKIR